MKRFALTLLALLLMAANAFAQTTSAKIPLRYLVPSEIVKILSDVKEDPSATANTPYAVPGIKTLIPNDSAGTLKAFGTPTGVSQLQELIRLLDVQPRQVQMTVHLVRVTVDADGKAKEEVLRNSVLSTVQNKTVQLAMDGRENIAVEATPHINGDNSVTLSVGFQIAIPLGPNTSRQNSFSATRRIKQNETVRLFGVSDSADKQVEAALIQGQLPHAPGFAYTAYFMDTLVTEIRPGAVKSGKKTQP